MSWKDDPALRRGAEEQAAGLAQAKATAVPPPISQAPAEPEITQVSIVDFRMPFWSMVIFLVKLSIAAIPAIIILTIIGMFVAAIFGAMFGLGHMGH